jgi:hypothetical protein
MYSFAQRTDTTVIDEPLYATYLVHSGVQHPGRDETLLSQSSSPDFVIDTVILGPCPTPVMFVKSMAHHLLEVDTSFLLKTTNVILTRDPVEMLPSLATQIPEPTLADTGLPQQVALVNFLRSTGQLVPIIDSRRLLQDPERVLRSLCSELGLDFDEAMLSWPAGPRIEDGVWAKYWYHNVHASTGFAPYRTKSEAFPERLRPLLDEARPHYLELIGNTE